MKKIISIFMSAVMLCTSLFAFSATAFADSARSVKFCQSEARKMLSYVNNLRQNESWYYNDDAKSSVTDLNGLSSLTYDYDLEKIAMQRAVELIYKFNHERPNGTTCFTAYKEAGYSYSICGENIAAGDVDYIKTAKGAYGVFAEEDKGYSEQGHRRNMLNSRFNAFGVACVYYNGWYYWAQEFSGKAVNTTKTTAFNDTVTVNMSDSGTVTLPSSVFASTSSGSSSSTSSASSTSASTSTSSKLKKTSIKKLTKGKKKITVQWKKVSGIKGYQVQVATDKKFKKNRKTVTISKKSTTKTTVKKLKSKKKYYVRVRTYKVVNNQKVYSSWSKVKTIKTK